MKIGEMLGESFNYAKEAVVGKWVKWILLIISCIIFPLILGYVVEVFKGKKPAPELEHWGKLFINGILYIIIGIIYSIPMIIIAFLIFGASLSTGIIMTDPGAFIATAAIGSVVLIIVSFIITFFMYFGLIRFAREEKFGEAFNFGEIHAQIKKVGWLNYFVALLVIWIVLGIIYGILFMIPAIGWIILLILLPMLVIWQARYLTLIYESA